MRLRRTSKIFAFAVLVLSLSGSLGSQTLERYLDTAPLEHDDIRLVVFHPEVFNIRALETLREGGILEIPNLTVIGVYHVKQRSSFRDSAAYVRDNELDWFKFHAVDKEISEPVMFRENPCTAEFEMMFEKADGIIFFGGPDLPPAVYGEKTSLLTVITDPYRHIFEASAVFHLLGGLQDEKAAALLESRPKFPILGICLGLQTLNVGTGGTLVQDIWSEAYAKFQVEEAIALGPEQWHTNPYRKIFPLERLMSYHFHSLQLGSQSLFCRVMGFKTEDHPRILSAHHQAIEKIGKGLVPSATSRDGKIIEAVEHKAYPHVLGVQFHPEHTMLMNPEPRFRLKPGEPPTSMKALLENAPPSVEFHKAIWAWFAAKLIESQALGKSAGEGPHK
jgi:putative glutamine amidotransferase